MPILTASNDHFSVKSVEFSGPITTQSKHRDAWYQVVHITIVQIAKDGVEIKTELTLFGEDGTHIDTKYDC